MPSRFLVLAGTYTRGRQKDGNRVTYKSGDVFDTLTDKETAFCRKNPQNFQEIHVNLTPKYTVKDGPNVSDDGTVEIDFDKLKAMNMRDLLTFCRTNGIGTRGINKEEVLSDIEKFINDNV
jgi:hypothetical protein